MPEISEEVFSSDIPNGPRDEEDDLRDTLNEGCCSPFRLQFERVVSPCRQNRDLTGSLSDEEKNEFFERTLISTEIEKKNTVKYKTTLDIIFTNAVSFTRFINR